MAQISAITINDGAATPVAHVFNPVKSTPPTYRRNGVAGQSVIAQERFMVQTVIANAANGVNRVQLELVVPVVETPASGAASGYVAPPAVAYELKAKVEFFIHNRSEKVGRKDLRTLLMNALANSQVVSAIEDLEQPY